MKDLLHYVREYPNALSAEQLALYNGLVDSHLQHMQRNGKERHANLHDSSWSEISLDRLLEKEQYKELLDLIHSYKKRYEQDCNMKTLPMPDGIAPMAVKDYHAEQGDKFSSHFDSVGNTCTRYLVFLFYLNNVEEGGHTRFDDLDKQVKPEAGKLLMFPPYWMYMHTGMPPKFGTKRIVSSYYLWWK